jgi:hypothetical protein
MLKIESIKSFHPPKVIRIIHYNIVDTVFIYAKNQKTTVGIPSTRTDHRLCPSLYKLHLYFLIEFKSCLKCANNLMPQRMHSNGSWTFMNGIFMLFLDMLDVAIVDHVRAS